MKPLLVLRRTDVADTRVATLLIVPDFDVVEESLGRSSRRLRPNRARGRQQGVTRNEQTQCTRDRHTSM